MPEEVAGRVPWRGLRTVAAGAAAVPMTAVFIGLGVAVLVGRSLLDVARVASTRVLALGGTQRDAESDRSERSESKEVGR